ncbi:MAG TPA: MFS transporter, partial [Longimicrobiales bacterium]|nr:MFS transporter [Longimicrobiales bacterium]
KKSPLAVLYGAVLVDMMGFGIVLPLLPFYAESMGATPLQVTLLIASFSATQLAAAPIWGRVSDRRGRRPLLIAGLFASAVSYLLFGLANSLGLLLLSRIAAGAAGGTISIAQAYVADTTTAEERARGMGHIGAASGLGVMLGPALGGLFSGFGLGAPGYVAAVLCTINALAAIYLLPESHGHEARKLHQSQAATLRGWLHSMTRFPLSVLLTVYFLTISSFTAMTAVLALYLNRRFGTMADAMAIVFTMAGGATVVVRGLLLSRIVRRVGESATVRVGVVALAMSLIALPLLPTEWTAFLVVPLWAFGAGTLFPALASLVSRASDSASQGSILGGSQVVGGLGRVVGPLWAGLLFQKVGIASPFHLGVLMVALAGLLSLKIPGRNPARAPAPAANELAPSE